MTNIQTYTHAYIYSKERGDAEYKVIVFVS